MKAIVAGATGTLGLRILKRLVQDADVTSIVTLTRRRLESGDESAKVTQVDIEDFLQANDAIDRLIGDADVCYWSIGTTFTQSLTMDPSEMKRVVDVVTIGGIRRLLDARTVGRPLRLVMLSGHHVIHAQDTAPKDVPNRDFLILRGQADVFALETAQKQTALLETYVAKIGGVERPERPLSDEARQRMAQFKVPLIHVDDLTSALVFVGNGGRHIAGQPATVLSNDDLLACGRQASSV